MSALSKGVLRPWRCIDTCGESFPTEQGLHAHQSSCSAFDEPDLGLAARLAEKRERKRARREVRRVSQVAILLPEIPLEEPQILDDSQPPEPIAPPVLGRGQRAKRPTWKVLEQLPDPPASVELQMDAEGTITSADSASASPTFVWRAIKTAMNAFGLYREYPTKPSFSPDDTITLEDVSQVSMQPRSEPTELTTTSGRAPWWPFGNLSIFLFMSWLWTGSKSKSLDEADRLVEVLRTPGFSVDDLEGFNVKRETALWDEFLATSTETPVNAENELQLPSEDGWKASPVTIEVPDGKPHRPSSNDPPIPHFTVRDFVHRPLVTLISRVWQGDAAWRFHLTPFRQYWQRPTGKVERVHSELFASEAFEQAHADVQRLAIEPGPILERVVCALMFWSDSTHLASFGTASLWPIYLFFGNESKYTRSAMRFGSCHHVGYIPKLPDCFYDWYKTLTGKGPSDDMLTHCRQQLMHAVWALLLDKEFMHAYEHGIVITFPDGITRRVYPRVFTYSADYPEKVLLATVRNMGRCPCPRCTTPKEKIHEIGMIRDDSRRVRDARVDNSAFQHSKRAAHKAVYESGKPLKGTDVENILGKHSYVPTQNAFSPLAVFGFNLFSMLVVDLMHEFELGVWKHIFVQLLRMLMECTGGVITELNKRYRAVPTFGRSTIRRFSNNVSAMKKLAAHNWEDMLQCALPVFEALFPPEYDGLIQDLIFTLVYWHALAKLRMHTDSSLELLQSTTKELGTELRRFINNICPHFPTRELPREAATREKRRVDKINKTIGAGGSAVVPASDPQRKRKLLNILTYKFHALGDYVPSILRFGTTDSYTTQRGELEHRRVKKFYGRTNKNRAVLQISRLELRERALRCMARNVLPQLKRRTVQGKKGRRQARAVIDFDEKEPLNATPPEVHHHISHATSFPVPIPFWLSSCQGDPLTTEFYGRLQDHLIERVLDPDMATDDRRYTSEERTRLVIKGDRMYLHKVLRVNFSTYDVRRAQDSMNPRRDAFIMTPARSWDDENHPFSYARILGILHVDVMYRGCDGSRPAVAKTFEVLWVRWFRHDTRWKGGFKRRRLHRVQLVPFDSDHAYGFLDPDDVIRGAHLIPAFAHGRTADGEDWIYRYVNMFVDRDMLMRYLGLGVGHSYSVALPPDEVPVTSTAMDDDHDYPVETASTGDDVEPIDGSESEGGEDLISDDEDEDGDGDGLDDLGPEDGEDRLDEDDPSEDP